jgi:hypothetical protein
MLKRHWKILIILLVVLPMVPVVSLMMTRSEGQSEVDNYRNSLIAKGEKFAIADFVPPLVPPEQNGADLVTQATALLNPDAMMETNIPPAVRIIAPGKAIPCFAQPDVRGYNFTNTWPNLLAVAGYSRPATTLLRQAMNFPALDFHIDYQKWDDPGLSRRQADDGCALCLSTEAICDLHDGDAASAATNICAILAIVNGERDVKTIFCQYSRVRMAFYAIGASWELLQSTNATDAELAVLQQAWQRQEFVMPMEDMLLMSRATVEYAIKQMRESDTYFYEQFGRGEGWNLSTDLSEDLENLKDNAEGNYAKSMWHATWTYSDELQMLQNHEAILETFRAFHTNGYFNPAYSNLMARLDALQKTRGSSDMDSVRWAFSYESEALGSQILNSIIATETARRQVITAIALKRYQLKHGSYPPDLASLVPEFVAAIPADPIDGKPMRYRLDGDGQFLLYSIGLNGKDDGGDSAIPGLTKGDYYWSDPNCLDPKAPDWVWPQPATPAEIQSYYDHMPK